MFNPYPNIVISIRLLVFMTAKTFDLIFVLALLPGVANANTFESASADQVEPFALRIYLAAEPKGALVQYKDQ